MALVAAALEADPYCGDVYLTALIIGPKFIDPREWIPELTGPEALNMPMDSESLAEPRDHRPRFSRIDDGTFDTMDWRISFLMGTGFSQKQWGPVVRGHVVTGDIIAPIRRLSETAGPATQSDAAAVAEALVKIRSYFMPKRANLKKRATAIPSMPKAVCCSSRSRSIHPDRFPQLMHESLR